MIHKSNTPPYHAPIKGAVDINSLIVTIVMMLACGLALARYQPVKANTIIETDFVRISLISGSEAAGQNSEVPVGLRFQLQPGWKVYWRSPGEAGLPPEFTPDAMLSSGENAALQFPVPSRFSLFGIDTYGYGGDVILPMEIEPRLGSAREIFITGQLDALICSDICVPVSGTLQLTIPAGQARPSVFAQQIARAAARVPSAITGPHITLEDMVLDSNMLTLRFSDGTPDITDIFVETAENGYSFGAPQKISTGLYQSLVGGRDIQPLIGTDLRLTVDAGSQFAEIIAPAITGNIGSSSGTGTSLSSVLLLLVIAFLGGMILNVMPCVLPVLTIKLASIAEMGGQERITIRRRMLATAAGILTSFAVLAAGLVLVQLAGHSIGWGTQFQNPYFLCFMSVVMVLFSLSLFDKITVPLPAGISQISAGSRSNSKIGADFSSGFLVTLLATPCSAPLVGTAVSFALASPPLLLFTILMVMGAGLAVPYLLGAIMPDFGKLLPRPGKWMLRVKQGLGLGLLGTLIWLLWLAQSQLGISGLIGLLLCLIGLCLSLFFMPAQMRAVQQAAMLILLAGAIILPPLLADKAPARPLVQVGDDWAIFSQQALDEAREQNKRVFVDVTADWCVTCKLNKAFVLEDKDVRAALGADDVVRLRADWTVPDDDISAYLFSFGRFGIPFNAVYGPAAKEPLILSELLSTYEVISALAKFSSLP
ncbi:MAG: thioredoxin family protein [Alphaproteobacteria bacterium]